MHIEIISGSPRQESVTIRVAKFLQNHLTQKSAHEVGLIDVRTWNIPVMQEMVYTSPEKAPEDLQPLVKRMLHANAFILVSPEYNGSYTPALKNLLDHFPKQTRKAFGIATASPGAMGGIRATQQMQLLINALFGIGLPNMLVVPTIEKRFDANNQLIDPAFQSQVDTFTAEFLWLAESLHNNHK